MRKNNELRKHRSSYDPGHACYLSPDGRYYCYEVWDPDTRRVVTLKYEVGKDGLTEELARFLDGADHDAGLNDRCEDQLRDPLFTARIAGYEADPDDEDAIDPWDTLPGKGGSPEEVLFAGERPEDPDAAQVRRIIDKECTEAQQNFIFDHFGRGMQLEEMIQAEAARTGMTPSAEMMIRRKDRILDKVSKALGVERVKRHRRSGED